MKYLAPLLISLGLLSAAAPPQRIVSTAPSITETLFAMGLGPRVVGVTVYCKFPAEAAKLPKIGNYLEPDVEAIVALHPDLVVVQQQPNHLGEELARLHIPYVEVQSDNLEAVYAGARAIGQASGTAAAADALVANMQSGLRKVKKLAEGHSRPSAVFLVGHNPGSLTGLIAGSGLSYFSDLLDIAGGTNIFSDASAPYPNISLEEILARNPDVILELSGESRPSQKEVMTLWQQERSLKAVMTGRIYAIPSGAFLAPGPRAVEAATTLLYLLHPELAP